MLKCDHCLIEFPETQAINDRIEGHDRAFCCHGCRGVYRLLNSEGLEEFYDRRGSSWTPGPPEEHRVDPAAFNDVLREREGVVEADIVLEGIRCASCIWLIEKILARTTGVQYAKVNYATHRAKLRWDPEETGIRAVIDRIRSIGYTPKPFHADLQAQGFRNEQRDLLIRFGTAAFFSMQLMLYSIALYAGYFQGIEDSTKTVFQLISLAITTPVLFYSGMPLIRGAARGIMNLAFNMDVLVVTGSGAAYLYSIYGLLQGGEVYFDTAAMIITLILLGRFIESGAKGRASDLISRLLSLNPAEARVVSGLSSVDRHTERVPVSSVKIGDLVEVVPGEKIPLDGTVVEGATEIDESMLTGESKPVAKIQGNEVFCGTQNLYGSIVLSVVRTGEDLVLSKIVRAVEDAQAKQAPVQILVDRIAGLFVPAILLLSLVTAVARVYQGAGFTEALMNAVSVLVIACPCALGLATPLAILAGTGRGASKGILIKGGDVVERTRRVRTVVLDKTGTLTEGRQVLEEYRGVGIGDSEALRLASSLERRSEHSLSKAIVKADREDNPYEVSGFTVLPGEGATGIINDRRAMIGSKAFIEKEGMDSGSVKELPSELKSWISLHENGGSTVVYLSYDGNLAGVFIISDEIRREAKEVVSKLRGMGFKLLMITGDSESAAHEVAGRVGMEVEEVMAQMSPLQKVEAIRDLQEHGQSVLMAGDGINDGAALVQADSGIAMGKASDVALESSDMVLMRGDLMLLPEALNLSITIHRIIRQNLLWAFSYNIVAVPLAVAGMLHPIVAALAMTLSSLSVVINSSRLRRV